MIGQMAITIASLGFSDLGRSVTPTFLFSTLSKNEQKNQCGKLIKFQDFCSQDMESCLHAAARRVQLWSLNADLFFLGTSIVDWIRLIGPFKSHLPDNISLQSSNCNILGLAATVAFFAKETRFTQI